MATGQTSNLVTIRPGDLLTCADADFLRRNPEDHNTLGALIGCCDVTALVVFNWSVRDFHERMDHIETVSRNHHAAVFGHSTQVREKFFDIHRGVSAIRSMRDRTMELRNGTRITFAYLEDGDMLRGFTFNSVWIVCGEPVIQRRLPDPVMGSMTSETRRGVFGPSRVEQLRQRFSDGADRSMMQVNSSLLRQEQRIFEELNREELRRQVRLMQAQIEAQAQTENARRDVLRQAMSIQTSVGVDVGVQDSSSMTISIQPMDADGNPVGEPIIRQVDMVDVQGASFTVEPSTVEPSEPVRFPEKRMFLKEDDE